MNEFLRNIALATCGWSNLPIKTKEKELKSSEIDKTSNGSWEPDSPTATGWSRNILKSLCCTTSANLT